MSFSTVIRRLIRGGYPVVTPVIRDLYRLQIAVGYCLRSFRRALRWYIHSKEYTNFSYEISEASRKYMDAFFSNALGEPIDVIERYRKELEEDDALRKFFEMRLIETPDRYCADLPIQYTRRTGWYVLVRVLKPRLVVEAGVDRGIGTCLLAAAVLRNRAEGADGRVVGLDVNPYAGRYLAAPYSEVAEVVYADSLDYLERLCEPVDLFIHDSNHAPDHEMREYELLRDKLSPRGMLVSDNARATTCLFDFARRNSMSFAYWGEEVVDHVATEAGIGLAIPCP